MREVFSHVNKPIQVNEIAFYILLICVGLQGGTQNVFSSNSVCIH